MAVSAATDHSDRNGQNDGPNRRSLNTRRKRSRRRSGSRQTSPRVTATAQTGRIVPAPPPELPAIASPRPRRRNSLAVRLGVAGLAAAFCGWLGIDLYRWIASAFDFSTGLGWAAAAAATAGIVGAGAHCALGSVIGVGGAGRGHSAHAAVDAAVGVALVV